MGTKGLLIFLISISVLQATSQNRDAEKINFCDSILRVGAADYSYPGLSIVYCANDTTWLGSYGVLEFERGALTEASSLFQLGSVGKVLTAIAVLQQVESGNLDLKKDIREYLPWIRTIGPTNLVDLLTHSAGMNDKNIGYFAKSPKNVQSLEEHLKESLPTFYQQAGLEINYSNYSYAIAGYLVEIASKLPFDEYVKTQIFDPLNMKDSFVGFDPTYQQKPSYAKGHTISEEGFIENEVFARHAIPAGSLISSARDMSKLIGAMANADSVLLNPASWQLLYTRQFSNHPELTGYSLGLEEQRFGNQIFWAKGGMLTGFLSQIVILPDTTAIFIAMNCGEDSFLEEFHEKFFTQFYESEVTNSFIPKVTKLNEYVGEYRNARYDRDGVESIISLFRGAFEVWEGEDGLIAYHNGEMHTYVYAGNDIFKNISNPNEKLVFKIDDSGNVSKLFRSVNIGGLSIPATFEKTKWYNSPSFVNEYYGFVPLTIILYGVSLLFVSIVSIVRIWNPKFWKWKLLRKHYYVVAGIGILAVVLHSIMAVLPLVKSPMEFLFGLPQQFNTYNQLSYLIALSALLMMVLSAILFVKNDETVLSRMLFGLLTISMVLHSFFLWQWNFL